MNPNMEIETMHFTSDKELRRAGYISEPAHGGGYVEYQANLPPAINWKHVDGPLLYTSDCGLHWLTFWERFQMFIGWTNIHALDLRHRRSQ